MKVLIVEDDADLLEMITLMLEREGMEVNSITTGDMLLETLSLEKPDIILMDVYLGGNDGRILSRQLKNTIGYSKIPVVLYSAGNISPASIAESQADDFLQKPADLSVLAKRLRACAGTVLDG